MIHLRAMTGADIPLGMRLKTQAGWNQTETDWRRFLRMQPDGCFVAQWGGQDVATTTTCIFGSVGWIAMVLVDTEYRHRGVGTRLVQHALSFLDERQIPTARLDATALGRPVYERLGFAAEYELMRMEGVATGAESRGWGVGSEEHRLAACATREDHRLAACATREEHRLAACATREEHRLAACATREEHRLAACATREGGVEDLEAVVGWDRQATGAPREKLLSRLLAEDASRAYLAGDPNEPGGYVISRCGSRAAHLGPAAAFCPAAGSALLDRAAADWAGQRIYIDVPSDNRAAVRWAEDHGLTCQRSFTRMVRGTPRPGRHRTD
jgi:ribosomal protein S18 acetylase RimI-like enzyme